MNNHIKISTINDKIKSIAIYTSLIVVFLFGATSLDLDMGKFISRLGNTGKVVKRLMVVDFHNIVSILEGMLSSILIAISALAIGFAISIILSFLAAENIAPNKSMASVIKGVIAIVRAIPALVWILMVVASLGFGNTGGMVGLIFPTTGYLTKSFTSSIEELGYDAIEALKTTGANRFIIIIRALMPSLISPFISWTAIRLEGNIAESISLGMVGVGGIGSMLTKALGKYNYGSITTIILVIVVTLFVVELAVNQLKKRV